MSFLHTSLFAAGAACVAIPILVHLLLRQRRKPIEWAAMRFLLEAFRKHRKKLRLQQFLLLAARCLVILLLALAIGRPLLQRAGLLGGSSGRAIYLLIDTGVSSQLVASAASTSSGETPASSAALGRSSQPASALDGYKAAARSIIDSLGAGDRVGLVTLGAPAEPVVVPASSDLPAVRELIDQLTPTDASTDIAGGLERLSAHLAHDASATPARVIVTILSDFRAGSADLARPLPAALRDLPPGTDAVVLAVPPATDRAGNVQIVSVEPLRTVLLTGSGGVAGGEQVRVNLRRAGEAVNTAAETAVRLRVERPGSDSSAPQGSAPASAASGLGAARAVVRWQPGQSAATATMQVDAASSPHDSVGAASIILAEIDRDDLPADNIYRKPIGVREALRVGIVAQRRFGAERADQLASADWIALALEPVTGVPMDVTDVEPAFLDQPTLANLDVVFLPSPDLLQEETWPRLRRFAEQGGMVVVLPPAEATVHVWTDPMTRALGLPWRIARESWAAENGQPATLSDEAPDSPMWSRLAAEMPALVRPVGIFKMLPIEEAPSDADVLLKLADGRTWMIASPVGRAPSTAGPQGQGDKPNAEQPVESRGLVVFITSALTLAWTDLPAKPLMVPLVQELVRQGYGRAAGSWSTVAGRRAPAPGRATSLHPIDAGDNQVAIDVDTTGLSKNPLRRSGAWQAVDEAGRPRGIVAVNADTEGARVEPQDRAAIQSWLTAALGGAEGADGARRATFEWLDPKAPGAALAHDPGGTPASLPLLIAAAALAILEAGMARWFSYARAPSTEPALQPA